MMDYFEEKEKKHWEQYETDPEYRAKSDAEQAEWSAGLEQREAQESKERNEAGRYTFKEAAELIANNSRSLFDSIYSKLEQAAFGRKLRFYAPDKDEVYKRIPVKNWYELIWKDLNGWLNENEPLIAYRFPNPDELAGHADGAGMGGNTRVETKQTTEWKTKAREIGNEWMIEQRKNGKDPGVIAIARYVEGELSNRNITGARGKFLDFETIKREALTGITGRPPNGKSKIS